MNRLQVLRWLNPILAVLVLTQLVTALLRGLVLPRDTFAVVHGGGGILLAVGIVLHIGLNWNWVRANLLARGHQP